MTGLTATEAAARILAEVRRQPALRVPLDDALGSVLAESVVSPVDIPAWTNSAMDGYAVRGAEVRGATQAVPKRLRVVEVPITIRARAGGESKKPKTMKYAWNFTKAIVKTWLR